MSRHSDSEQRVFEYIQTVIAERGYAPSLREIGEAVGLKSPSTVQLHIRRLQEKGLLQKTGGGPGQLFLPKNKNRTGFLCLTGNLFKAAIYRLNMFYMSAMDMSPSILRFE